MIERRNPVDLDDIAAATARPGMDPRVWVSFGTVRGDPSEPASCIAFDEAGQPLVSVMLHPWLREVRARVGMRVAGNGEAEWHPFFPGDEVLCVLPEGDFRAGVTIVHKLCNELSPFPTTVGGQDPSENNFSFTRTKTPHVHEQEGPLLLRSSKSGGLLSIDDAGVVTLRGGGATPEAQAPVLQMSQDVIGMQGAPPNRIKASQHILQINIADGAFLVQVEDMVVSLVSSRASNAGKPSTITIPGALSIGTVGNPPLEHVMTTEAVANIISNAFLTLAAAFSPVVPPMNGSAIAGVLTAWVVAGLPAAIAAAAVGVLDPGVAKAIQAAFAASTPKPLVATGQVAPGIGCPGLLVG